MREASMRGLLFLFSLCSLCLRGESLFAHPVPKDNHDRIIEVTLTPAAVVVKYHLEVDESRAELDLTRLDVPKEEFARITTRTAFQQAFIDHIAPILLNNLYAKLDGEPLVFESQGGKRDETVKDHLRCDFTFAAVWQPAPDRPHTFAFREANYEQEDFDRIQLALTAGPGVTLQSMTAPDKALLERPPLEYKPGDAERLRKASATFLLTAAAESATLSGGRQPAETPDTQGADAPRSDDFSASAPPQKLLDLLLDTRRGLVVLLLLAAGFGAVHALTPGHGKTLVAAYLVGERGTVWHALLLGVVTTLTHTGAVFLLAGVFLVSPPAASLIYYVQGLVGGLFIAGLGLWLLVTRLSGRADHFHLGGHHHHHHGHDRTHADHSHGPVVPDGTSVRWWHLLLLGMRGGLVPCWDAIVLLCLAIAAQQLRLAIPLLLAFSAGLAGVLVALGVGVVWARNWAVARWGDGPRMRKFVRVLPLVSAAVITALGLWLCYDSLHPETPPPAHSARP